MQAASAALLALLAGCGPQAMPRSLGHALAGQTAPSFRESATSAREVGIPGGPRTRVTVLDFWASWCAGCRESIPALDALFRARKEEGVMVVGVSIDVSGDDAIRLARELRASFPIVLDPGMQIAGAYRVTTVPLTFVVDRQGTVRWVGRDPVGARQAVAVVLAER